MKQVLSVGLLSWSQLVLCAALVFFCGGCDKEEMHEEETLYIMEYSVDKPEGFIIDIVTGKPIKSGYAIAYRETLKSKGKDNLRKVIDCAKQHEGIIIGKPDKDDNTYYYESCRVFNSLSAKDARKFANENCNCAVYKITSETKIESRVINYWNSNDSILINNKRIRVYNPYKGKGNLSLKGMLHCHTDNSQRVDKFGSGSAEQNIIKWRDKGGYDFFSITDHNYATDIIEKDGIINLGKALEDTKKEQHLVVLNLPADYIYVDMGSQMATLSPYYQSLGAYVVYAHPMWEGALQSDDQIKCAGFSNFVEVYTNTIESSRAFDIMLSKGYKVFCLGVDDYHYNESFKDSFFNTAWVVAFARNKDKASIWDALLTGASYASTGAQISNISLSKEGVIEVTCPKPSVIRFLGYNANQNDKPLALSVTSSSTYGRYQVVGNEKYIRVVVQNERGKASSQAFVILP